MFMLAELLVGCESRLAVVAAPANASLLSSLGMACNISKLFSPAQHNGGLYFNLLHVAYPSFILVLVRSTPIVAKSLSAFDSAINQIYKVTAIKLKAENRLSEYQFS